LIIIVEIAYKRSSAECQAHIILYMQCNCFIYASPLCRLSIQISCFAWDYPSKFLVGSNSKMMSPLKIGGRKSTFCMFIVP
jgi:hypothetical protein